MANTHIVFSKVRNGFVMDGANVRSYDLANNQYINSTPIDLNFGSFVSKDGASWINIVDANTSTANALNSNARWLLLSGGTIEVGVCGNSKIHIMDAS